MRYQYRTPNFKYCFYENNFHWSRPVSQNLHSAQTPPSLGSSLSAAGMKNMASRQRLHAAEGFLCVLSQ